MTTPTPPDFCPSPVETTLAYHERTKHSPHRYAASLGYMDWATQPDPFRRYAGAPTHPLTLASVGEEPRYEPCFLGASLPPPAPVDHRSLSALFEDSLGLSAWKEAGTSRWALRINPSSGNLHPTEAYLVAGASAGLHERAAVYHYAPRDHLLERRTVLSDAAWSSLAAQLPDGAVLLGLTSIHWRESWKYGERAFRYCQHDAGHAIAALSLAAAALGWRTRLLDERVTTPDLLLLLGAHLQSGIEAEHADCLLVVYPRALRDPSPTPDVAGSEADDEKLHAELDDRLARFSLPGPLLVELMGATWQGAPNALSPDHQEWPVIDDVAAATEKRAEALVEDWRAGRIDNLSLVDSGAPVSLRRIVRQRRSAQRLDGRTGIARDAFYQILLKTLPGRGQLPFDALPWRPRVHLLLFVHRVADLAPGLYFVARDGELAARTDELRAAFDPNFVWTTPPECPASLPLFLLEAGDARRVSAQASCGQDIASDGSFAVAMLAEYRRVLEERGAWFYRRLHWEAGAIGQVLYLEAEASGIRGTGIGCFFDDVTHRIVGLRDDRYQSLYHFTMGGSVEDERIRTAPPYAHLAR